MNGQTIVTAAEMRAAEQSAVAAGTAETLLMERAGAAAAATIWRFAGPRRTLVLCGPGNNGGDGYVVARLLRARGVEVQLAALAPPATAAAIEAAGQWTGDTVTLAEAEPAPLLIDALFGTGLTRPLGGEVVAIFSRLAAAAVVRVAIDLPSGATTDDGAVLSAIPDFDLTITFGAMKPSHLLQPAARHMGRIVLADIGVAPASRLHLIDRPKVQPPGPDDHKYRRGYVAVLGGDLPGAAALAASGALAAGAGYVRLIAPIPVAGLKLAIVQGGEVALDDPRIGALVVGPGLGRGVQAAARLEEALASGRRLVLDADALSLLAGGLDRLPFLSSRAILTPHEGEFSRLFGDPPGCKVERARAAARISGAVVVLKGADTVIASPGGRAAIAPLSPPWLASAGTGDVLAGIIATMRAQGMAAFEAACAGVWLHGRAAEAAGPGLAADDLLPVLPGLIASCR